MKQQAAPIYGDIRSPIRLAFQHIPLRPPCWSLPPSAGIVLNIDGHSMRQCVVRHMNKRITTIREGKSNNALYSCVCVCVCVFAKREDDERGLGRGEKRKTKCPTERKKGSE